MAAPHDGAHAMPDILTTLKKEHDQLRALFERMNATDDSQQQQRQQLLQQVEELLIPHAKWEETVFYPAFAERADHQQLKTHAAAIEEHRVVEMTVLPDVKGADSGSRQFAGSVQVFGELIDHHATEEENKIFAAMRELYSAQELTGFDGQYADWKASSFAEVMTAYARTKSAVQGAFRIHDNPL
jgi:hemerythrin-like domain-containing protein